MTKIAWITDSMANFSKEEAARLGVDIVPIQLIVDGSGYSEVDLSLEDLHRYMIDQKKEAKTSQPIFGDFIARYERLKEEGYDCAIAVHCSNGLSSTVKNSSAAAEAADFKVYTVDSHAALEEQQELVRLGLAAEAEGKSVEEIVALLEAWRDKKNFFMIIGNMETMRRGGRVSSGEMFLANILNIKPIITLDETGKVIPFKKARSLKKAYAEMVTELERRHAANGIHNNRVFVQTALAPEMQDNIVALIQAKLPDIEIVKTRFCPSIAVHAGFETVGILWLDA
ncbi:MULTISPECIES: DegV family protein [Exiguobacterium]|uniref:DegV family protein n=1 Tax=Exiguobacterium TaxID=33986 RepID=UPI00049862ED|nr:MULTISPECIES: DegV family protein [Exiguobacterium]TCI70237.1 DegV family protein [Exiguobacterium sp. IPCI3]TCI79268.1 DegV family protein [Exiguobacterium sp. IPCH1]TCI81744.1 DegV family protein [Exiguobacterium sp. IPBC4]